MKAIVLAGDSGASLKPLTIYRPKALVSLVDRPVIQHVFELLKLHGVTEIIVVAQHLARSIQDYYGDGSAYGLSITYVLEEAPMGSAGSVKQVEHLLSEPFLVMPGDVLTDFNLSWFIKEHAAAGAVATLALYRVSNPQDYGVVVTDAEGTIRQFLEKPSWSEVSSDTISSGIYVLNPAALAHIEPGKATDWLQDVFPRMLLRGDRLQGHTSYGYWNSLGTIDEYVRASGDYLSGRVNLPRLGRHIGGELWVDSDAEIAPDAQLDGPIYIGHGTKIRGGAIIHGPAVIRDYTTVDAHASIDRSIIWRNSYVGERAELRGAVVSRQVKIMAQAVLSEGVVVGDGAQIGAGAVIQANLKIWPIKEVDEGATVTSSLIWGSQARRTLFGRRGVSGLVNIEMTPELCTRLGAAYGATLHQGARVLVNDADDATSRMLAGALRSGLLAAGVHAVSVNAVPLPVARYLIHGGAASCGVQVNLSALDDRVVDIKFFDRQGLDIDVATERAIERTYFQEDYRRAALNEIGRAQEIERAIEIYSESFFTALDRGVLAAITDRFNLVIGQAAGGASSLLSQLLRRIGCDLLEFYMDKKDPNPTAMFSEISSQIRFGVSALRADLGVYVHQGGEKLTLVDDSGQAVSPLRALLAMADMAMQAHGGGSVAVPVTAPRAFDLIAARRGGTIIRTRTDLGALMRLAAQRRDILLLGDGAGNYIFPSFSPIVDACYAVVKLMGLLASTDSRLSDVIAGLPGYYLAQQRVPCPVEKKAKVMRIINQHYPEVQAEQIDGIKIALGDEWVLIRPDPDGPFFHIYAEGASEEAARILIAKYDGLITGLQ